MRSTLPQLYGPEKTAFKELTGALEVRYHELRQQGVWAVVKHTGIFNQKEEERLWKKGVISDKDLIALQRAVFFYIGKAFCLRGGQEQHELKASQFVCSTDPDCFTYVENGSKNRLGVNLKMVNKVVPVYSCPSARPRCLVYLLDLYFSKFPAKAKELDLFYLQPVSKVPAISETPWYTCSPVGRDNLSKFVATKKLDAHRRLTTV